MLYVVWKFAIHRKSIRWRRILSLPLLHFLSLSLPLSLSLSLCVCVCVLITLWSVNLPRQPYICTHTHAVHTHILLVLFTGSQHLEPSNSFLIHPHLLLLPPRFLSFSLLFFIPPIFLYYICIHIYICNLLSNLWLLSCAMLMPRQPATRYTHTHTSK